MSYKDAFGMEVTYGVGEATDKNGVVDVTHFGAIKQIQQVIDFDKDGIPSALDLTIRSSKVPAGSAIVSAKLAVLKPGATTATTLDIGLVKLDSTAIDADGLVDGATCAAGLNIGAGALIGSVLSEDGYVVVTPSATTAAALGGLYAVLVVEYI